MAPVVFAGALPPKKKSELQDIASALNISDEGTKDELQSRIKKHLDNNPDLEDDPQFAGLYGRRKRSVQPQTTGRLAPQTIEKPRSSARITPLDPVHESTLPPVHDLKHSSTPFKRPLSPALSTPQISPRNLVDMGTPSSLPPLPPSPAKSIIEAIPKPAEIKAAVQRFHTHEIVPNGTEYLEATRAFLSNSQNIWTLTALLELLQILRTVIPWKTFEVPVIESNFPYPPLSTFQTSAFWLVLLHWALPTLIAPAFVGNLISFTPSRSPSGLPVRQPGSQPPTAQFDPLTAAIIRLAMSIAYPYDSLASQEHVYGLDVLGYNLRVFNAALGLAFAFAEAISVAPKIFARTLAQDHRLAIAPAEEGVSSEMVIAERESEEVD